MSRTGPALASPARARRAASCRAAASPNAACSGASGSNADPCKSSGSDQLPPRPSMAAAASRAYVMTRQHQGVNAASCSVLREHRVNTRATSTVETVLRAPGVNTRGDECSEYRRIRPKTAECVSSRALVGRQECAVRF